MKRADLTEKLLDIKREKGWTWKYICEQIGGMSPVMITGALIGNHKLTKPQAAAAAKLNGRADTREDRPRAPRKKSARPRREGGGEGAFS